MNVPFKNLFKRRENATGVTSHTQKRHLLKPTSKFTLSSELSLLFLQLPSFVIGF